METINHECYVSLEVAKLLKQAGFDWEVYRCYETLPEKKKIFGEGLVPYQGKAREDILAAPSLAVAQKWLREVKGYYVFVTDDSHCIEPNLIWVITHPSYLAGMCGGSTYEDYLEAGINKCLTILLED